MLVYLLQASAVQMTHYLNNIMCKVSEHFTSLEGLKVRFRDVEGINFITQKELISSRGRN